MIRIWVCKSRSIEGQGKLLGFEVKGRHETTNHSAGSYTIRAMCCTAILQHMYYVLAFQAIMTWHIFLTIASCHVADFTIYSGIRDMSERKNSHSDIQTTFFAASTVYVGNKFSSDYRAP